MKVKINTKFGPVEFNDVNNVIVFDAYQRPMFVGIKIKDDEYQIAKVGDEEFEKLLSLFNLKPPNIVSFDEIDGWKNITKRSIS